MKKLCVSLSVVVGLIPVPGGPGLGRVPGLPGAGGPPGPVRISAAHIVVATSGGARAIITRVPFAIAFQDARGHTVLRERPATATALTVAPLTQSEFGALGPAPATLYAPLSFLVGTQTVTQTPAGQWEGTLGSVAQTGVKYSAQAVLSARAAGRGVVLTLSTNDPSGRVLLVRVSASGRDTLDVEAVPKPAAGVATMADSFLSSRAEAFRGFGGRHNSLDQHGGEFYNWLAQENVASGSPTGLTAPPQPATGRYLFPNGPHAAYYVQSSFVSSAGYGFLLRRDELSHWRLDSDRLAAWQAEVGGAGLAYHVVAAPPARAVAGLTAITGRQPVAPGWAVGSTFDRLVKFPPTPPPPMRARCRVTSTTSTATTSTSMPIASRAGRSYRTPS